MTAGRADEGAGQTAQLVPDPVPRSREPLPAPLASEDDEVAREVHRRRSAPPQPITPAHAARRRHVHAVGVQQAEALHEDNLHNGAIHPCTTCGYVETGARRGTRMDNAEYAQMQANGGKVAHAGGELHFNGGMFCAECMPDYADMQYERFAARYGEERAERTIRSIFSELHPDT